MAAKPHQSCRPRSTSLLDRGAHISLRWSCRWLRPGSDPLFDWPCAFAVICRLGAAALRQCQPSGRDRTGACAARLVAVLSAGSAGRSHLPVSARETAITTIARRSRSGSRSGRHPRRCPGRLRHRPARPPSGQDADRGHAQGLSGVGGLGPRTWPAGSVRDGAVPRGGQSHGDEARTPAANALGRWGHRPCGAG
jgi:hypothetical protein